MRGDDDQTSLGHLGQDLPDQLRRLGIEFGRRFVCKDHATGKHDAGDTDAHALPAGEIVAAFRNAGIEPAGQKPFVEQSDMPGRLPQVGAVTGVAIPADRFGQRARRHIDVRRYPIASFGHHLR